MTSASGRWALDLAESLQAAGAGQAQVEQNGVDALGLQQAIGVLGGIGDVGDETEGQRDLTASIADGAFVIDDEEVEKISGHDLRSSGVAMGGVTAADVIRVIPS